MYLTNIKISYVIYTNKFDVYTMAVTCDELTGWWQKEICGESIPVLLGFKASRIEVITDDMQM